MYPLERAEKWSTDVSGDPGGGTELQPVMEKLGGKLQSIQPFLCLKRTLPVSGIKQLEMLVEPAVSRVGRRVLPAGSRSSPAGVVFPLALVLRPS